MKRVLVVCVIVAAICFTGQAQRHSRRVRRPVPKPVPTPTPERWVTYNSEPGRFSVLIPEIPTDKTETIQSDPAPYTTHFLKVRGLNSAFIIGWAEYDPSFDPNPSHELELNRENFIKGINGSLITNKSLTLDGFPSIEFTAETASMLYKSRIYLVGRRPYQLLAITAKGLDDSTNINRFFDSFKVRVR